ncbi:MAG: hypothetical protein ACYCW6_07555 [Candidatus Xenobia bacterium]
MHRQVLCLLIALVMLTLPAQAGIGRLTPEMAKRLGGAAAGANAHSAAQSTSATGPGANGQHGPGNSGGQPGTNPDGTAGSPGGTGPGSSHSNVGLFLFLALLVLGGTGAGIFFWMRKQQAQ